MVFLKEEVLDSAERSGFAQAAGLGEIQCMEEAGHASLADLADTGTRSHFWIQTILYCHSEGSPAPCGKKPKRMTLESRRPLFQRGLGHPVAEAPHHPPESQLYLPPVSPSP